MGSVNQHGPGEYILSSISSSNLLAVIYIHSFISWNNVFCEIFSQYLLFEANYLHKISLRKSVYFH